MTSVISNWARNITFGTTRLHRPRSVDELQSLVAGSGRLRALGTGHSFNRIADTSGDLVSVDAMPWVFDLDPDRGTVRVSAGLRYGEVAVHLDQAGHALANLGSLPHISVAGAVSTGTHGSGDGNGNLATSVAAIEFVRADGAEIALSRAANGDRFLGAVVALGALGVITTLTLDVQPTFEVQQYVYQNLPREQFIRDPAEVFGAGYSVSLFTSWKGPVFDQVWVKHRMDGPPWHPPRRWLGATLADGPLHPVAGMPAVNCTEQLGVPGPWHTRLPHFKLGFTPSSGEELQSEYLIPAERLPEALRALEPIADQISSVLHVSELRTIAADELWLSPSYHRDSVGIHFTWHREPAAVGPVLALVEERLAPLHARPHWGKVFGLRPETVRAQYPRLGEFRDLVAELDPTGKFRNDWLDDYLWVE